MQQVLFHLPFTEGLLPPDGLPLYGFGAMLFLCFVLAAVVWGPVRAAKIGLSRDRLLDLCIVLFLTGIAGARLVYMIQYRKDFGDKTIVELAYEFVQIWNGGIVFYGSAFGAVIGYTIFYFAVLKKNGINTWKLADVAAPLIAVGLAVGRIGCYLNGCCWGQVANEECQTVPLSAELGQFPLLPAHARSQVCRPAGPDDRMPAIHGLQTSTGFTTNGYSGSGIRFRSYEPEQNDPRVVLAIEASSTAQAAGLAAGDRITAVNGKSNLIVVDFRAETDQLVRLFEFAKQSQGKPEPLPNRPGRIVFETAPALRSFIQKASAEFAAVEAVAVSDSLAELVRDWPRGKKSLELTIAGRAEPVTYTPRTVTFFPTQLYETVSMVLLIVVLMAFQPLRRHDGQVMVVFMLGYAVHRFLNEAIRIEPTYSFGLTLSQWISVGIVILALVMELYLRLTRVKLPPGLQPLGAPHSTPTTA